MTYLPPKNKKVQNLSLILILAGIVVTAAARFFPYQSLIQLAALVPIVLGIQFLVRFVLSDMRYIIDDRDDGTSDFIVYKKQGSREVKVCHVSLAGVTDIFPTGSKKVESRTCFNYCQNLSAAGYTLLAREGDSVTELRIEPDEAFLAALKQRMGGGGAGINFAMN